MHSDCSYGKFTGQVPVRYAFFGYHCPGADEGVRSDGVTTDNGAVGAQGSAFCDKGGTKLVHLGNFGTRIIDIGKYHGWSTEDAVF